MNILKYSGISLFILISITNHTMDHVDQKSEGYRSRSNTVYANIPPQFWPTQPSIEKNLSCPNLLSVDSDQHDKPYFISFKNLTKESMIISCTGKNFHNQILLGPLKTDVPILTQNPCEELQYFTKNQIPLEFSVQKTEFNDLKEIRKFVLLKKKSQCIDSVKIIKIPVNYYFVILYNANGIPYFENKSDLSFHFN